MSLVSDVLDSVSTQVLESTSSLKALEDVDFNNIELLSEFKERKKVLLQAHKDYLASNPKLKSLMADYTQTLLLRKPENVYEFTLAYFNNTQL